MLIDLNDSNYSSHVESFDGPIFIDFYSPTCGPCQEVLAQLPHLDNYFKDEAMIAKVNVTENPKLAKLRVHHKSEPHNRYVKPFVPNIFANTPQGKNRMNGKCHESWLPVPPQATQDSLLAPS